MTREEAIRDIEYMQTQLEIHKQPRSKCLDMAIKALETVEEFEKAHIITGGRLNGRTYAYKCGLEDGKRKVLEQEPCEDAVSREKVLGCFEFPNTKRKDFIEAIRKLPPVTPTRKKGKWIAEYDKSDGHFRTYHCSNCENLQGYTSNFCEECGSENREVEE